MMECFLSWLSIYKIITHTMQGKTTHLNFEILNFFQASKERRPKFLGFSFSDDFSNYSLTLECQLINDWVEPAKAELSVLYGNKLTTSLR